MKAKVIVAFVCFLWVFNLGFAQESTNALPPDAQEAVKKGILAAKDQDYLLAIRYFEDARKIAPNSPEIFYNLGLAESQIPGRELRAICWFGAFLTAEPNSPKTAAIWDQIDALDVRNQTNIRRLIKSVNEDVKSDLLIRLTDISLVLNGDLAEDKSWNMPDMRRQVVQIVQFDTAAWTNVVISDQNPFAEKGADSNVWKEGEYCRAIQKIGLNRPIFLDLPEYLKNQRYLKVQDPIAFSFATAIGLAETINELAAAELKVAEMLKEMKSGKTTEIERTKNLKPVRGWYYNITNNIGRIDLHEMGPFSSRIEAEEAARRDHDEGLSVGPCFSEGGNSTSDSEAKKTP